LGAKPPNRRERGVGTGGAPAVTADDATTQKTLKTQAPSCPRLLLWGLGNLTGVGDWGTAQRIVMKG
jgi:hypothetical protein